MCQAAESVEMRVAAAREAMAMAVLEVEMAA